MVKSLASFFIICILAIMFSAVSAWAGQRFIDNGDGTVTDHETGLMWSQTDNQGDISWHGAQKWIRYTFPYTVPAEYENWRLPTLEEIRTLFDPETAGYETDCGQWVKITPRIQLTCAWVWTSENKAITARVFNFRRGYHYLDRMVHKKAYRSLAVRNIKDPGPE